MYMIKQPEETSCILWIADAVGEKCGYEEKAAGENKG